MRHEAFEAKGAERLRARVLVYSCYFGFHEPFNADATGDGIGYDRLIVTDHARLSVPGIRMLRSDSSDAADAGRMSRLAKLCPHRFFSNYDWVIYIDNSAVLTMSPQAMVEAIEWQHADMAPAGRYFFEHGKRTCAYREARVCLVRGKITRQDYRRQVRHYKEAGFPEDQGLFMNTLMIQKMGDPATDAFNETWFQHFQSFSQRDQISLPYMLWKERYPARVTPFALTEIAQWPIYSKWKREKFRRQVRRGNLRGLGAALQPDLA